MMSKSSLTAPTSFIILISPSVTPINLYPASLSLPNPTSCTVHPYIYLLFTLLLSLVRFLSSPRLIFHHPASHLLPHCVLFVFTLIPPLHPSVLSCPSPVQFPSHSFTLPHTCSQANLILFTLHSSPLYLLLTLLLSPVSPLSSLRLIFRHSASHLISLQPYPLYPSPFTLISHIHPSALSSKCLVQSLS